MTKEKIFISFDFDNDSELRDFLVGQSKNENSPFEIADWSLKESLTGDWKEKIKPRIRKCNQVIVICGENTHKCPGIDHELSVAQEENMSYFLLKGRKDKTCTKPTVAKSTDTIYSWTWDNLEKLIHGAR
ncbi:hypothetical protein HN865_03940 [Candidatus Woesearchaeota archaeon]|jgi:hypothetical protein|nr:hypothetical protein [Candidatus Woesearchaeota archaeon]